VDKLDLVLLGERVNAAVDAVERMHPEMRLDDVKDFVRVREWKLGMECMLDNLNEKHVYLAKNLYVDLTEIGKVLGMEPHYWESLSVVYYSKDSA
jgi:hypothetical protein